MLKNGLAKWSKADQARQTYYVGSCDEMVLFGEALGKALARPCILALSGDLGAGKTTLAKGIVKGLCGISPECVASPTFQYVHFYSGNIYPSKLKNWEFSDEEYPRFGSEKTLPLLEIGGVFAESKMGYSSKEKTNSSVCLGMNTVVHFDLWRMKDEEEFLSLGLEEFLSADAVLIEWPDRIQALLPASTIHLEARVSGSGRALSFTRV